MIGSQEFLKSVIDTISDHVAVLDADGVIRFANRGWVEFAEHSGAGAAGAWLGVDYLEACDRAAAMGDEYGSRAGAGIREVIDSRKPVFKLEYPCHSPDAKRWFIMNVTSFRLEGDRYFVVSHQDITQRKLAEEKVLRLSRIDGLTNVHNRRYFDDFLAQEWKRCIRLGLPITMALIDIDYFKLFNDTYGHHAGDECLKRIAAVLSGYARRPSDLCARYGGEEFALIFGNTDARDCLEHMEEILKAIRNLAIAHEQCPVQPVVTASLGAATLYPRSGDPETSLIEAADAMLYRAKQGGRNRAVCQPAGE